MASAEPAGGVMVRAASSGGLAEEAFIDQTDHDYNATTTIQLPTVGRLQA